MEDQFGIFGRPIHWRDTMKSPRLLFFDARLIFFFVLLVFHLRLWTFGLLLAGMLMFWLIERAGYRFPSALRALRSRLIGPRRPARASHHYRCAVDYGFEGHPLLPFPAPAPARMRVPGNPQQESAASSPGKAPPYSLPAE